MTARDVWRWTDERGVQRLVGTDELRSALASAVLPASTLVWREGMKEWAPASTLPELASAAFAANKPADGAADRASGAGAKEPGFDPRTTAERRATLVGVHARVPDPAAKPPEPPPAPEPTERSTQVPPYGAPTPEPRAPGPPKVPATPAIPTPKPGATLRPGAGAAHSAAIPPAEKPFVKRKPATSDIDALWATTTHSDEDETIPRRVRPSELAAAAAASAEAASTLREARAKARLDMLAKRADAERVDIEAKKGDGGKAPSAPARHAPPKPPARKPPPLPPSKDKPAPDAGKAQTGPAKGPAPRNFAKTSPGVGRPPPLPPHTKSSPAAVPAPAKPVVPPAAAQVRIKPPAAGPAADAISGESRTLHVSTLAGVAPPKDLVEAAQAAAPAKAAAAEKAAVTAPPEPELPRFADDEESTETMQRPGGTPAPAPVAVQPTPVAAPQPAPVAAPQPAPAVTPLPAPVAAAPPPAVLHFSTPESLPLPPTSTRPPPTSTRPPPTSTRPPPTSARPPPAASVAPEAAAEAPERAPSRLPSASLMPPRKLAQPLPVSIPSVLGAGGVLIGMVIAAFFVGRATAVPAPRLLARPTMGPLPALVRGALPPPPKPCWMVKQPAMWAPKASRSIPFDVVATGKGKLAVGYARDAKTAVGIEVDLVSGEVQARFQDKGDDEIERVAPTHAGEFHAVRAGAKIRSSVEVPDAQPPFVVGLREGGIVLASPPSAAPTALWPVSGDEGLGAAGVEPTGAHGFVLTFRRQSAVFGGAIGADLKPKGDLVKVEGSGGSVGKPAASWNGREVGVIFADRPSSDGRYEIRIGHAAGGQVPSATAVLPLPKGGPGGDAFAPDIAGLADGRWVIMWTEGAAGSRAVRAQTLAPDFTPLGDAIALSPPAGNFGQGEIGVVGDRVATVFLSKGEKSYELWGAVLQCQ